MLSQSTMKHKPIARTVKTLRKIFRWHTTPKFTEIDISDMFRPPSPDNDGMSHNSHHCRTNRNSLLDPEVEYLLTTLDMDNIPEELIRYGPGDDIVKKPHHTYAYFLVCSRCDRMRPFGGESVAMCIVDAWTRTLRVHKITFARSRHPGFSHYKWACGSCGRITDQKVDNSDFYIGDCKDCGKDQPLISNPKHPHTEKGEKKFCCPKCRHDIEVPFNIANGFFTTSGDRPHIVFCEWCQEDTPIVTLADSVKPVCGCTRCKSKFEIGRAGELCPYCTALIGESVARYQARIVPTTVVPFVNYQLETVEELVEETIYE
ncbi:uncharacterized protein I303_105217 [Kwoniella dejecticola CBS 10117]|uniref:Uncharacterized protein n=1 Tax=Kwoniella dejecticola CBS 10117 TaxID=1296121 RepID=A0A1A6A346_9TREE|nr:uncharacterized protein I303_05336 [Kwoniella dejecticola CBS 10117]OBR84478.1 hypothetical protein I303_05336 [Kwoniella dejecticola CBS 10117]